MAKQTPVIAAGLVLTVDAILCMDNLPIEGWVWPQSARRQERAGKLAAITDSEGEIVAWQRVETRTPLGEDLREPTDTLDSRTKAMPIFDRSSASISRVEMMIYAGRKFKFGRSRTANLSEDRRQQRASTLRSLTNAEIAAGRRSGCGPLPMEDAVERVTEKVRMFHTQRFAQA